MKRISKPLLSRLPETTDLKIVSAWERLAPDDDRWFLKWATALFHLCAVCVFFILSACIPTIHPPGNSINPAHFEEDAFFTEDGERLSVRSWFPEKQPLNAIIIALHGFNDYSNFFDAPGEYLSTLGIGSYAFDQRGFGESPNPGLWPGISAYVDDLVQFTREVKQRHPSVPVYLLGESMGGAVVIVTMEKSLLPEVEGIILSAPAIWGRDVMPWYQRSLLWLTAHTVPWMTLTGESLEIMPSDNIEMLRALSRDPLVIKETRVETIYGLVDLMDEALEKSVFLGENALLLYGEKDEVIPKAPTFEMLKMLPRSEPLGGSAARVAFYENGYHMLLRDLQANLILDDIVAWIAAPKEPLPSGADSRAAMTLNQIDVAQL